ncbi:hypothetical protein LTR85_011229 [Meristemomyces frigidus]|nr:hypothetical protein LTR85_011229 [Meristemomyces frigidus]
MAYERRGSSKPAGGDKKKEKKPFKPNFAGFVADLKEKGTYKDMRSEETKRVQAAEDAARAAREKAEAEAQAEAYEAQRVKDEAAAAAAAAAAEEAEASEPGSPESKDRAAAEVEVEVEDGGAAKEYHADTLALWQTVMDDCMRENPPKADDEEQDDEDIEGAFGGVISLLHQAQRGLEAITYEADALAKADADAKETARQAEEAKKEARRARRQEFHETFHLGDSGVNQTWVFDDADRVAIEAQAEQRRERERQYEDAHMRASGLDQRWELEEGDGVAAGACGSSGELVVPEGEQTTETELHEEGVDGGEDAMQPGEETAQDGGDGSGVQTPGFYENPPAEDVVQEASAPEQGYPTEEAGQDDIAQLDVGPETPGADDDVPGDATQFDLPQQDAGLDASPSQDTTQQDVAQQDDEAPSEDDWIPPPTILQDAPPVDLAALLAELGQYGDYLPTLPTPAGAAPATQPTNATSEDVAQSVQQDASFIPSSDDMAFLPSAAAHFGPVYEDTGTFCSQSVAAHTTPFAQPLKRKASSGDDDDDAAGVGEAPARKRSREE